MCLLPDTSGQLRHPSDPRQRQRLHHPARLCHMKTADDQLIDGSPFIFPVRHSRQFHLLAGFLPHHPKNCPIHLLRRFRLRWHLHVASGNNSCCPGFPERKCHRCMSVLSRPSLIYAAQDSLQAVLSSIKPSSSPSPSSLLIFTEPALSFHTDFRFLRPLFFWYFHSSEKHSPPALFHADTVCFRFVTGYKISLCHAPPVWLLGKSREIQTVTSDESPHFRMHPSQHFPSPPDSLSETSRPAAEAAVSVPDRSETTPHVSAQRPSSSDPRNAASHAFSPARSAAQTSHPRPAPAEEAHTPPGSPPAETAPDAAGPTRTWDPAAHPGFGPVLRQQFSGFKAVKPHQPVCLVADGAPAEESLRAVRSAAAPPDAPAYTRNKNTRFNANPRHSASATFTI